MSSVIAQGACPKCGSSDAFTEYDDGHSWCYSCKHYKPPLHMTINNVSKALSKPVGKLSREPPNDSTTELNKEAYLWIKQYGVTNDEIKDNNILWSPSTQMLIFPMYGESKDELLMWQGRYFPRRNPKVYTSGNPNDNILLVDGSNNFGYDTIVVVEDVISAIKVTRVVTATPLFGAHLSLAKAIRLSQIYKNLVLWLDHDKTGDMLKFKEEYTTLFNSIKIISTKQDPKEFTTEQIKELINHG